MSGSGWEKNGNEQEWVKNEQKWMMGVDGSEWELVAVHGSGGSDGSGWEHDIV